MILLVALLACETPPPVTEPPPQESAAPTPDPLTLDVLDSSALSALSTEALSAAPTWLQPDLELAFRRLDADTREELAALIVDLDDPRLTDEVAFSVAHLSPEVLTEDDFDPQLLLDNAAQVYAVDEALPYAEVIDQGEPGVDADYSTTVRYTTLVDDVATTVDLPADIYYWYIVHPRIEDEHPLPIDAWSECHQRDLECPTPYAEGGTFWRTFLWDGAAETCPEGEFCPMLSEDIGAYTDLWSSAGGWEGAVGGIASFMLQSDEALGRWLNFGAGSERSVQPNRIYGLGAGNCGEWADMTSALARLALIPNQNATPSSWDHTWNRFYDPADGRWVAWEPVNGWFDHAYGAPYANHITRGDGAIEMITADDTSSWFTMEVVVTDQNGAPVDGATVSIYSPYDTFWWWAGEQLTDATGTARFELTAGQQFAYRVDSDAGDYPSSSNSIDYASDGVEAGATDVIAATVDDVRPAPVARVQAAADVAPTATLRLSGTVDSGRIIGQSSVYGRDTYTIETAAPSVSWFVTTTEGYAAWLAGEETPTLAEGTLGAETAVDLDLTEGRVLVLVNDGTVSTAALGTASLQVEADDLDPVSWSGSLVLLPGDHRAFALGGGV